MAQKNIFTAEQLDFLKEMFSIGAGNAATAFSQLFECRVEIEVPKMTVMSVGDIWDSEYYDASYTFCTITKMTIVGDVVGNLFFIVQDKYVPPLIEVMEKAAFKIPKHETDKGMTRELQNSMLAEMGNIFAGTYLGAISRFCKLNIIHTLPILEKEKLYIFLERFIRGNCRIDDSLIMIDLKFTAEHNPFEGLLLIILSKDTIKSFTDALHNAKETMGVK
jgi:chemotaxis protein CheC